MPPRNLFAIGAIGDVVQQIQEALIANACALKKADRVYGKDTAAAVTQFQTAKSLAPTGAVDETTWQALMEMPVPAVGDRALQLTAAFEGHGFQLAVGNFDGALLTWGIIGFTMTSGEVQQIVNSVNTAHPELVQNAFADSAEELLQLMSADRAFQKEWANSHTLKNGALAEPWKTMFATFGSFPEVQAEQIKHVRQDYLNPAIVTAGRLGCTSELALALCFDIHVQNGGIKPSVLKALLPQIQAGMNESDVRVLVANAVADSARAAWKEDVRRRKLTVATGDGIVHGHKYHLESWGLSGNFAAPELVPTEAVATAA